MVKVHKNGKCRFERFGFFVPDIQQVLSQYPGLIRKRSISEKNLPVLHFSVTKKNSPDTELPQFYLLIRDRKQYFFTCLIIQKRYQTHHQNACSRYHSHGQTCD